jgi:hypothetical protein
MDEFGLIENADLVRLDYAKKHPVPSGWKNKKPRRWFWRGITFLLGSAVVLSILVGW